MNAVTHHADHVRSGAAGDRLDSTWFGAGYALKEKAWAKDRMIVKLKFDGKFKRNSKKTRKLYY